MQKVIVMAASLLATAGLFAATPGVALAQGERVTIAVNHADLDLATPEGQRRLERRIGNTARKICGLDSQNTGTRMASPEAADCYRQAISDVRQRLATVIESSRNGG